MPYPRIPNGHVSGVLALWGPKTRDVGDEVGVNDVIYPNGAGGMHKEHLRLSPLEGHATLAALVAMRVEGKRGLYPPGRRHPTLTPPG